MRLSGLLDLQLSISSDSTRLAIGATGTYTLDYNPSGKVVIYDWDGSSWEQVGDDIEGVTSGDQFGISVSISSHSTNTNTHFSHST